MIPVVALVGRPNVGKSTLFNQITGTRNALVANLPGLTRDRQYGQAKYDGREFILIDTGGISASEEDGINSVMAQQSKMAIEEADVVLLVVDARAGLTPDDEGIARHLRQSGTEFLLVVNKVDGVNVDLAQADFYQLGVETIFPTTATHGRGVKSLLESVVAGFDEPESESESELDADVSKGIKIGVIGRPNVGKSTLVNRMLGEDRVVVYDHPGTTRDSIYIDYVRNEKNYTLIDTAGVRRRKNIKEAAEKFSIVKTLKAIEDANVVVLVFDAREAIVDQDLHLLGTAIDAGRGLVLAINKWDNLDEDQKNKIKSDLDRRLQFVDYVTIHYISALHGTGVGDLYKSIEKAYRSATQKLQTHKLTNILQDAVRDHQPPMRNGHRIKLRYAHAGGSNPPIIVVHGNQTERLPEQYKRYLEKTFRRKLGLAGTPVRMEFKTSDNPYEGRRNKLKDRDKLSARARSKAGVRNARDRNLKKR